MKSKANRGAIRQWMISNANRFFESNGINCTKMVETWDIEQNTGESTLDSDHDAWAIAVQVAEDLE